MSGVSPFVMSCRIKSYENSEVNFPLFIRVNIFLCPLNAKKQRPYSKKANSNFPQILPASLKLYKLSQASRIFSTRQNLSQHRKAGRGSRMMGKTATMSKNNDGNEESAEKVSASFRLSSREKEEEEEEKEEEEEEEEEEEGRRGAVIKTGEERKLRLRTWR
ncbi:hypothetical protein E2C01_080870 [Portunus trituberculatus]|uniref:Uncharacterized protein n=1 Tax=Portunus trituberculatus TaxID=210409 RepID=A0A5B7IZI3_PORTR|nr:hypothetical protein [Portunus trituberculatus]